MQQYRNNRNNGNIYDLRKDLQHTPPPSQQKGSSGSADGRYGFNGEPLSFAPDRTANGTVRRTRTDNSIEFPCSRAAPNRAAPGAPAARTGTVPRSEAARPSRNSVHPARPASRSSAVHRAEAAQDSGSGSAAALQNQRVCARHNSSHATRYSGKNARSAA